MIWALSETLPGRVYDPISNFFLILMDQSVLSHFCCVVVKPQNYVIEAFCTVDN